MDEVKDILHDGEERARKVARETMAEVHDKMMMG
jgi:hypothetical protein